MEIRIEQAFKHHGSRLAIHKCKCQRVFRCRGRSLSDNQQQHTSPAVGKRRTCCQYYDFKHVAAPAAAGQRNRFLQLQPASCTKVPLTHATVYWSGLRVVVFCSGALGAHTSHCQSVFCLNPQTSPFTPAFVSNSVQTGCFWLPTQVIGTFSLNL